MWKSAKFFLVVLSVALNIAFVAVWLAYAVGCCHEPAGAGVEPEQETGVWCPLHRELGVDRRQWQQIEPRLKEFQASAGELRQRVGQLRSEVIEMIASKEPDLAAIRTKQDEILASKRKIQRLVVAHLLTEKRTLTPDQQEQLFEMLRNRTGCPGPPMSGRSSGAGIGDRHQPIGRYRYRNPSEDK